jgi:uncharacterized membrane protein YidH (DUF202 family)
MEGEVKQPAAQPERSGKILAMKNDDTLLPWQYTVLALLWVGMFLDAAALWFAFTKSAAPEDVRAGVRPYAVAYLVGTIVLTPMLIAWGKQNAARAAQRSGIGGPAATYLFVGCLCLLVAIALTAAGIGTGVFTGSGLRPWRLTAFLYIAGIANIIIWRRNSP